MGENLTCEVVKGFSSINNFCWIIPLKLFERALSLICDLYAFLSQHFLSVNIYFLLTNIFPYMLAKLKRISKMF
jgi:hypothetical protein